MGLDFEWKAQEHFHRDVNHMHLHWERVVIQLYSSYVYLSKFELHTHGPYGKVSSYKK